MVDDGRTETGGMASVSGRIDGRSGGYSTGSSFLATLAGIAGSGGLLDSLAARSIVGFVVVTGRLCAPAGIGALLGLGPPLVKYLREVARK